jgi:hypothetical protein
MALPYVDDPFIRSGGIATCSAPSIVAAAIKVGGTITVMKAYIALVVLCCSLCAVGYGEKRSHEYQTGKLTDISTDERLIEGTTYRHVIFTIQVGALVYTTRGGHARNRGGDMGKSLVVGDPVKVAEDGDHLLLLLPDGKELKTKVVRRARVQ